MGIEKIVIVGAEMVERAAASTAAGAKMLDEVAHASPAFAKIMGIETSTAAKVAAPIVGKEAGIASSSSSSFSRLPREMTEAETEAHLERLIRAIDDRAVGLPPKELTNQGLGARLWQFGTAGGDVLRERAAAEVTGKWSSEMLASREWLKANPQAFTQFKALPESKFLSPAQMVRQGESTQFAVGPLSTALRTDNVATCAAIYCRDGAKQFLGHADGMIHSRAVTEALETAGINLDKAYVTLMPGPLKSPVLETILPAFLKNENAMSRLRIIPFRGPSHGSVVAHDGALFVPTK